MKMTQRVFDVNNEQDMKDLWDILPVDMFKIKRSSFGGCYLMDKKDIGFYVIQSELIKIDWHDKTEITRPIQEAREEDVGKLCVFWDNANEADGQFFGIFRRKTLQGKYICDFKGWIFKHCRRLTKEEIEKLC